MPTQTETHNPSPRHYDPTAYQRLEDPIREWQAIADRQQAKDRMLMPMIARHFVPGRVLELGGGVGQLSMMLRELGWDVVASDFQDFFVEHQRKLGLESHQVDATNIAASGIGRFNNIFCHSITPFITHDYDVVAATYRSTRETLEPGGRLVMVHAMEPWRGVAAEMRRHTQLAREAGYTKLEVFRNQLLPSGAYRGPAPVVRLAETLFARSLGSRFIVVGS